MDNITPQHLWKEDRLMKFGVMVPHWGESSSPETILSVAQEAEILGFDSLWLGDHVSVPLADDTAARDRFYEMITTLGYLVGVTKRIKLGTGCHDHTLPTSSFCCIGHSDRTRAVWRQGHIWWCKRLDEGGVPCFERAVRDAWFND